MPSSRNSGPAQQADLHRALSGFFDPAWYRSRYPDVARSESDPLHHFIHHGLGEYRDPNRFFDSRWYLSRYPDVARSGQHPLLHYLSAGAAELRNPHPRFDAVYYADQHPEAAGNPLLYHLRFGLRHGWLTENPVDIRDYLPSGRTSPAAPRTVVVDVVIPVYRGLEQTRRCIESVLADGHRPMGRLIVVNDCSPEAKLATWLDRLSAEKRIDLLRNRRNLGFVASANAGMGAAAPHDVVLLNSDTEVPPGWLARLAGHAYATPHVATVSPFSNNATICGYPGDIGGPPAFGLGVAELDAACAAANAGRSVGLPTSVGFCMYIRRAALADVGPFDAATFGRGYGEENDFCLRAAARGWRHMLACDTFVYHEGSVSFGAGASAAVQEGMARLRARYPHYDRLVAQHVSLDKAGPCRFAVTAELFRRSGLPTILMLAHDLGGGVRHHVLDVVRRTAGSANHLLLETTTRGAALSVPALFGHPVLTLPADRVSDLATLLASMGVTRAHIHHLMGMDIDARSLLHRLGVPFDVTVHDYFAICPQVNLLPRMQGAYCGEPDVAACNACIAERPSHGALDIISWRRGNAWQFLEAERVICPSEDVRHRLAHYGLDQRAVVMPHEPVPPGAWKVSPLPIARGEKLRIAVIGVLAHQKGAVAVMTLAAAADPSRTSLHLIGYPEQELPPAVAERIAVTGKYEQTELPALLAQVKPHVVWFPSQWPETYSYTLTAAIDAGLPIVASRIGAFPERLQGRGLTWLVDPEASPEAWLGVFDQVRTALGQRRKLPAATRRPVPEYYRDRYVVASAQHQPQAPIDLRRDGRVSVVAIPERFDSGALTPCAYIRLIQPLDHPAIAGDFDVVLADADMALHYRADIIVTQRHGVPNLGAADALIRHCRANGISLLYDLDDDLRHVPRHHPDAEELRPKARIVARLVRQADAVWASTPALAAALADLRRDIGVVENGLDERLWSAPAPVRQGPVRILFMGTATHDADFALVEGALERLHAVFGDMVAIDLLGVSARPEMPPWVNRIGVPVHASGSYPGFVNWITRERWDFGIAPLADTAFNQCKSAIKTLDYAAMGLPVLASDREAYRGSLADGVAGWLVADDEDAWFVALARLVRDTRLRQRLADAARAGFATRTLAAQAAGRRDAWLGLLRGRQRRRRAAA
ncbi:MAG TPA: glycosyltransferase [Acetobacteraceae bacterium]|nr:glycosyltransferase [Acetobacteraceae bacterium]